MRGWTHYISGLAMATFFPPLLADLAQGNLLPILSGVYAYLPDFIDFKIKRFLWKRDIVIDPAPQDPVSKVSPRRILVKDLDKSQRWRFYYLEGTVERVLHYDNNLIVFTLKDETNSISVVARDEDAQKLISTVKEIKEGARVRIPGYLELDEHGIPFWNVSDAPHPQYIADSIAKAIDVAYETGKLVTVKVLNIRMKGDLYRRFIIHYDSENQVVRVYMGPLVSTGGLPFEGTETPSYRRIGEARTKYPFKKIYPRPTIVDAFSGPEIGFQRVDASDGSFVEEVFIPWHRGFSHSFTAGLILALPLMLILRLIGYNNFFELTIASMLGYWMHVIEDQLGFMGSVLLPPVTKRRVPGLMLGPRIYGAINFATAWLMISLVIWNINRHLPLISDGVQRPIHLPDLELLLLLALPSIAIFIAGVVDRMMYGKRLKTVAKEKEVEEAVEEREEVGGL